MEYLQNLQDLPQSKCIATIKNRPLITQLVFLGLGVLMLFNQYLWIPGLAFIALAATSYFLTKEYIACKVYEDRIAVFNPKQQDQIRIVEFKDLLQYEIDMKAAAYMLLIVQIGPDPIMDIERVGIPTFQAQKLRKCLYKLIPAKDFAEVKTAELNKNRLSDAELKASKAKYKKIKAEQKLEKKNTKLKDVVDKSKNKD